jgi:hypothetical protein
MTPTHRAWLSDDGQYYALPAPSSPWRPPPAYDVLEVHGSRVWLAGRYGLDGSHDVADPRCRYAEFPRMVGSWTNLGYWHKSRRRFVETFRLTLADLRQDVVFAPTWAQRDDDPCPWLAHYEATFRHQRRISAATWQALQDRIAQALLLYIIPRGVKQAIDAEQAEYDACESYWARD